MDKVKKILWSLLRMSFISGMVLLIWYWATGLNVPPQISLSAPRLFFRLCLVYSAFFEFYYQLIVWANYYKKKDYV